MTDIAMQLRSWTIDWNGAPMVDGEPPRDGLHCDLLRNGADEIDRLRATIRCCIVALRSANESRVFTDWTQMIAGLEETVDPHR